jgi:hypothetical protein
MEARILRNCVICALGNIRFVYNALAPQDHHTYDAFDTQWEHRRSQVRQV